MRLLRVGPVGAERPVAVTIDGRCLDLRAVTADIDGSFLARLTTGEIDWRSLPVTSIEGERIGAPIARPGVIACIGMNYAAHAAESGSPPPAQPVLFYKAPNTVVGPYDDVLLPRGSSRTDWEVELGVVIGRTARYLESPEQALAYVAGYVLSNDLSERDFQLAHSGGQWSKGKSCETYNPLGPALVTPEEVADPPALRLRSWVNGSLRQDSTTKDMIFGVATLLHHLSQYTVLEPGDLINTGTPEGVGLSGRFPYLRAGDVVETEIDLLGRQRNQVRPA